MTKRLLLFKPNTPSPVELVPTTKEWDSLVFLPKTLECTFICRVESKMRTILLKDGRKIQFNMWADEEGILNEKLPNLVATLITDPFAEARGPWRIVGNAILEPYDNTPLLEGDWKLIEAAIWSDEKLLDKNCQLNGIHL